MQNRSRGAPNNSRNDGIPPRGALVDPQTYGMLLWQSKLQEKLVQEQKEKRQRELDEQQRRIRERQEHPHPHHHHRAHNYHHQSHSSREDSSRAKNQNATTTTTAPAANTEKETTTSSPILEIPPQMFPGPAPYMINPPPTTPQTQSPPLLSPPVVVVQQQQHQQANNNGNGGGCNANAGGIASPSENLLLPNGPITTTASSPGGLLNEQQPMFPDIPTNRIRTSVSCDNFGKPPPPHQQQHHHHNHHQQQLHQQQQQTPQSRLLKNIVSFQQLGGAGSPRRSPSGKLLTVLRGDPEIRYHQKDTRGFDQTIRYLMDRDKVLEYKRELDLQLEEKRKWRSRLGSGAVKEITSTWKGFIENGGKGGGGGGSGNKTSYISAAAADQQQHHNPTFDNRYQTTHQDHHHQISAFSGGKGSKSGVELAPLMRKFNSLPKLAGLSSTDVTRPYVHSPRNEFFHPIQPNEVAETLSSQLREKEWLSRRQRENERLATERHFQTWDSLWGRPGAGAPLSFAQKSLGHAVSFGNLHQQHQHPSFNRVNLFKALHMSHQQLNRPK